MRLDDVVSGISGFNTIPGRLQHIPNPRGIHPFVDYAHTPDALDNVLQSLIETKDPEQRIITVFGCGGDRDRSKRPQMGSVVSKYSDVVVVTSDNPRGEDPQEIIDEIFVGIESGGKIVERISDRRQAIHTALDVAQEGDIILIAGKGHEEYQILADKTIHFSDVQEVDDYLNREK
jgi:UDP-N-acetylmuramyl-tripeptide synthetase